MEALLYKSFDNNKVECLVCNHYCLISSGNRGKCGVRENRNGILEVLNYNKTIASSIDPIEKKPIYHFLQHTKTYSFATVGCNMYCLWCQNHEISQVSKSKSEIRGKKVTPEHHIRNALLNNCPSISYTYSEPTIFFEYAFNTMKIARQEGIKNIWVSNGFMSKEVLDVIIPYLDAINIDYKGTEEVYKKYCSGSEIRVLENINRIKESGTHIEITILIIEGVNDSNAVLSLMAKNLENFAGLDIPLHLSRFFPSYRMKNRNVTSYETMYKAKRIFEEKGFTTIHLGNM